MQHLNAYAARDGRRRRIAESLLSLFDYFRCLQALRRCEEVVLADLVADDEGAWAWLPLCSLYGLQAAEVKCVELAARDSQLDLSDAKCGRRLERLQRRAPKALLRVLAAMSHNLPTTIGKKKRK